MKKKMCFSLILFISSFFLFGMNVNARSNEGYCIYNFDNIDDDGSKFSVMIKQDSLDNTTYYHVSDKVVDPKSSAWIEDTKNDIAGIIDLDVSPPYTACPSYAVFYKKKLNISIKNTYIIYFSTTKDIPSVTDTDVIDAIVSKPISGSGITTPSKSTTGYDATCDQTDVDWLFSVDGYDKSCLYANDYTYIDGKASCLITQLSWKSGETKPTILDNSYGTVQVGFGVSDINELYANTCPVNLNYSIFFNIGTDPVFEYKLTANKGISALTAPSNAIPLVDGYPEDDGIRKILKEKSPDYTCDDIITGDARDILKGVITLFRVLVPIILIVMGVYDFGSAVFAGDEDKIKKAQSRFIRRLLIGAAFFVFPILLKYILQVAYKIWGVVDPTLCGLI